jgi:hypothetical protein
MILNFESCYKRSISGRLLGDYVVQFLMDHTDVYIETLSDSEILNGK